MDAPRPPAKDSLPFDPRRFVPIAFALQGALIVVAVIVGGLIGQRPLEFFAYDLAGLVWGLLGTLPLLGMLGAVLVAPGAALARFRQLLDERLLPIFARWTLWELATLSLLAGVGEEMLFRGVLQTSVAAASTPWAGILVASVVFGAMHSISWTYLVLTTLIGVYLGWLYIAAGNLLAPMIAHGLYDFIALVFLLRRGAARPSSKIP